MKIENLFQFILISFLAVTACNADTTTGVPPQRMSLSLSADSSAVELRQVPEHILEYFQSDSLSQKEWQSFFSVYPDASNPELRGLQAAIAGRYVLHDSTIVFIPQEKFQKDSAYYARCYTRSLLATPSDIIKGKNISSDAEFIEFDFKR